MSLESLIAKNLTAPIEKELNHQKEQKARWKQLAKKYKNLLSSYERHQKVAEESGLLDPEEETLLKAARILNKEYDGLLKNNSGS